MGHGRWRGGAGVEWIAVNEGSTARMATSSSDGDEMLGKGAAGGWPTPPCRTYIERGGKRIRVKPHRMQPLEPGDRVIRLSSGGGGVGDPRERPPEQVLEDVRAGIISLPVARDVYGVAIDPDGLRIDQRLTAHLRAGGPRSRVRIAIEEPRLKVIVERD